MPVKTFLFLSTTDWDAPQFGSRQQIARVLARRGHRVLFVEIPRALHSFVSDPAGARQALRRLGRVRQISKGPLVFTPPPVLPIYYNPAINALNQRLMLYYLRRLLTQLDWQLDVLWTYWPNTAYLVGRLGERVAVYHCIDDFVAVGYPLTPRSAISRMEAEQCRRVDLIFTRTDGLFKAKQRLNADTYLLPGGVDTSHFDLRQIGVARPDVVALAQPRVGFVGTIDDRLDVALLARCAQTFPKATFVFVGPVKRHRVDIEPLENLMNVHFLPSCTHAEVPAIMAAFDVCLIPYVLNDYTSELSPIKLYEYLALGKSVVATDLPYLQREADYITIAQTTSEFVAAVQNALTISAPEAEQRRRRNAARKYSWNDQVDQVEQILQSVMMEKAR